MIVVDPDAIAFPVDARNEFGESLVHPLIGLPLDGLLGDVVEKIMKERPENPIRKALVVSGHLLLGELDREEAHAEELLGSESSFLGGEIGERSRPADPPAAGLPVRPREPRSPSTHARLYE